MNTAESALSGILRLLLAVVLARPVGCRLRRRAARRALRSDQSADQPRCADPARSVRPAQEREPKPPPPEAKEPPKEEVKITPRQAEELFHSVDEILDFDSKQTGLPIKKEVKRKLTSRDEVVSYLTKHLNDEDTKRLRRSELVLKKFGLLPRDFNLETFLVALLREEVAGYYDPKTKTVNLLDWVPIEEQEPVMAHELTHALQDQSVGLQKWMKKGEKDLGEIRKDPTPADIENDEMDNAREAVIEGQAQAMMFQYAIAPTGHSIVNSPALVDAMEEETLTGTPGTKVFNDAPIFMKESLTFPYSYGMDFVVKLMQKGGKEKAFAGVLRNPPHTTRQIMQPETYLVGGKNRAHARARFQARFQGLSKVRHRRDGRIRCRHADRAIRGKAALEAAVSRMARRILLRRQAKARYQGRFFRDRSLGLLYVSRWSSADKAAEFAEIYAHSLKQRYKKAEEDCESPLKPRSPPRTPIRDRSTERPPRVDHRRGRGHYRRARRYGVRQRELWTRPRPQLWRKKCLQAPAAEIAKLATSFSCCSFSSGSSRQKCWTFAATVELPVPRVRWSICAPGPVFLQACPHLSHRRSLHWNAIDRDQMIAGLNAIRPDGTDGFPSKSATPRIVNRPSSSGRRISPMTSKSGKLNIRPIRSRPSNARSRARRDN